MGIAGWKLLDGVAVSDALDNDLLTSWPESDCGFDEWYFTRDAIMAFPLEAICNHAGLSVGEVDVLLEFPNPVDIAAQLERVDPLAVIGEGTATYVITPSEAVLGAFVRACHSAGVR
jgi:hypothetical protein